MTASVHYYVYGIVPAGTAVDGFPGGLDDAPVSLAPEGALAALVSELPAAEYSPEHIENRTGDVEWLSPRAIAHDRVLSWASEHGPVIPLPMFSAMFSSPENVRLMLRDRRDRLTDTLAHVSGGREYALRIYRVDAELASSVIELNPDLRHLANEADNASPGQRYLLRRKLDDRARGEVKATANRLATTVRDALAAGALDCAVSPIPGTVAGDAPGTMVLNAAFLVPTTALTTWLETASSLVDRYQRVGLRFDLTGPWPPYHFVGDRR